MRIDHDTADRVLARGTSKPRRRQVDRTTQQDQRRARTTARHLLRALHDHAARFETWSPTPRIRPTAPRTIAAARRAELADGLSAAAGVGCLVDARGKGKGDFACFTRSGASTSPRRRTAGRSTTRHTPSSSTPPMNTVASPWWGSATPPPWWWRRAPIAPASWSAGARPAGAPCCPTSLPGSGQPPTRLLAAGDGQVDQAGSAR